MRSTTTEQSVYLPGFASIGQICLTLVIWLGYNVFRSEPPDKGIKKKNVKAYISYFVSLWSKCLRQCKRITISAHSFRVLDPHLLGSICLGKHGCGSMRLADRWEAEGSASTQFSHPPFITLRLLANRTVPFTHRSVLDSVLSRNTLTDTPRSVPH